MADKAPFNKPFTDTQGEQTNPTTSTVLADTGALPSAGIWEVRVTVGGDSAASYDVQHRNAANDGNSDDVPVIYGIADQSGQYVFRFACDASERVRVLPHANITGDSTATVEWEKLA